ncbi:putative lysine exporter protein [Enterobacter asburiae]|uniref:Putative lysine exporter protein n=1 Tax=Enterobacter asburiae TaxID=61645 RepID=A0A376FEN3_ENTAS|nr:putative lysine exporter protein [Enterobacter asburiae]
MSALGVMHLITCTLVYLLVGYGSKAVLATPATGGASDKHGIGRDNGADRVDIAI